MSATAAAQDAEPDTTPPLIILGTPYPGAEYTLNEPVLLDFNCVEVTVVGSGVEWCNAGITGPEGPIDIFFAGSPLPTSVPGTYLVVMTAGDRAGNATLTEFEYTVTDNTAPVARPHEYTTSGPLTVDAPGPLTNDTDVDGDRLTVEHTSGPSHGHLTIEADGSFTYTPNAGFSGIDGFFYRARDDRGARSQPVLVRIRVTGDSTAPEISVPALITADATSPQVPK